MKKEATRFTCDGCSADQMADSYISAPHGWRYLSWGGGYEGVETRNVHFCQDCCSVVLKALDEVLKFRGT